MTANRRSVRYARLSEADETMVLRVLVKCLVRRLGGAVTVSQDELLAHYDIETGPAPGGGVAIAAIPIEIDNAGSA
jgi:hypothetical protein